jgi:hypothetical protein
MQEGNSGMTLELAKLTTDLDTMSETLAQLDQARRTQVEIARERLKTYANALDEIEAKVQITRKGNLHWRGSFAAGDEPLDTRYPCPEIPSRATIIANDGSQVPLDRHAAALYYALNIGYIVYTYGTDRPPRVGTEPSLHYHDDELFDANHRPIPNAVVNARRTVREMQNLARLAEERVQTEQSIAVLSDGPLMWVQPGDTPQERRENLAPYLEGLSRLRAAGATATKMALGGYVDRPGSTGVTELLHLASLDANKVSKESLARNDLVGLIDARVFDKHLGPGERSALFIRQSPTNRDYKEAGHEVFHCYLNVSAEPTLPLIVRLEMPSWVAQDPARRDLLHAVIWQQCQVVGGYPYVLARAHELALISTDERRDLEEMVIGALRRRGLSARPSEKAWQKSLTGGVRRRHRL